jgi:hypothetical protein
VWVVVMAAHLRYRQRAGATGETGGKPPVQIFT